MDGTSARVFFSGKAKKPMVQRSLSTALICASVLALGAPAMAQSVSVAPELNGKSLNGKSLNGKSLNGASLNGENLNGESLNLIAANKISANKLAANKLAANKLGLNGVSLNTDYGGAETPFVLVRSVTLADGTELGVAP